MRRVAVAAIVLAACTTEAQVLGGDGAIRSCDDVWLRGALGDPCDFPGTCVRDAPPDPMCCTEFAYCRMTELVVDMTCNPDCAPCLDDHECAYGAAVCDGNTCIPCPFGDPTGANCPPCPADWVYLSRNGCQTCECAPSSTCDPATGMCGGDPDWRCYPGAPLVPGCTPDDIGCAVHVCAEQGCLWPPPIGCFMDCSGLPCQRCASTACTCDPFGGSGGQWICQPVCLDGFAVNLPCAI